MRTVKLGALLVRLGILGKRSRFLKGGRWKGSVVLSEPAQGAHLESVITWDVLQSFV